jgi:hypothetical protein
LGAGFHTDAGLNRVGVDFHIDAKDRRWGIGDHHGSRSFNGQRMAWVTRRQKHANGWSSNAVTGKVVSIAFFGIIRIENHRARRMLTVRFLRV